MSVRQIELLSRCVPKLRRIRLLTDRLACLCCGADATPARAERMTFAALVLAGAVMTLLNIEPPPLPYRAIPYATITLGPDSTHFCENYCLRISCIILKRLSEILKKEGHFRGSTHKTRLFVMIIESHWVDTVLESYWVGTVF